MGEIGGIEGLGDAATGAVVARAVEPGAGEASDGHTHESRCLNCGAELDGPYCHSCGQRAQVHRTLHAFFHDFLHGVLHFEGKIRRTLPLLAWKPGKLTRRYIDGQRASFVSPIALFLFSVFLMFAVLSLSGGKSDGPSNSLAAQQKQVEESLTELRAARNAPGETSADKADTDEAIKDAQAELEMIKTMREHGVTSAVINTDGPVNSDIPFLREAFEKAKANPELVFYKLKTNSYKLSWAIIPLSAPFVWLLFPFSRRFRMYDHVVFVTYSLSFMTLLVVLGFILSAIGADTVAPFLFLVPPVHMFWQLRGAYGVSRWGALWRTFLLTIFAVLVLSAFVALIGLLGAFD